MRHLRSSILTASFLFPATLLVLSSCSGGKNKVHSPPNLSAERSDAATTAPPIENVQAPITHLDRAQVNEVVDRGMGHFLQTFSVEESLDEQGRFQGFRITGIEDRDYFEGLGIGRGDIVTRINEQPIERPAEAYAVFVSLKTASRLDIDYLRGGRTMRLSLPIVGKISPQREDPSETVASGKDTGAATQSAEKSTSAGNEAASKTQ